ncbi:MAG TPA: S16 family serine protease [Stackebrandtia sp.]|jgi:PDZ domain-containing protein|uniref:YlbL family protein n=1 Tax=Stackebrandtia sp. TaxID=2023065 RepID=UPI002D5596C4|nr:S16 family serine protease [Stackebrandtia sp.]HZE39106.1 S16 family serine protease [Stackebrandtia sp.]
MKRRGWTVLIGAILVSLLTWQALSMNVAYVGLGPGPTYDALAKYKVGKKNVELISADDKYSTKSKGELRLVTVRIYDHVELVRAIYFWLSKDYAVIPRDLQFPPDKTDEQIAEEQQKMWQNSQQAAETAALQELGHPVHVTVKTVDKGSAASKVLKPGDVIASVNGGKVTSQQKFVSLLENAQDKAAGKPAKLGIVRDKKNKTVKLAPAKTRKGNVYLPGVKVKPVQDDPYGLKVTAEGLNVGGPSAGTIFALAMIDRVSKEDLTGGRDIVGTGEIDEDGHVLPIGGVEQKVVAASEQGASIFLTPAENCAAAKKNAPHGLRLLKIHTLHGAVQTLKTLSSGGNPPTCLT